MSANWDRRFMELAEHVATWSKDPEKKVGSVIVDNDRRVVSHGYNGFPRGVLDDSERYADVALKLKLVVHAEANAILNALTSVRRLTLYATQFPCSECAKLIIQSGIRRVLAPEPNREGKWAQDAVYSMQMFKEAAIIVRGG